MEAAKHINVKVTSDQSILANRQSWQLHHPYGEQPELKVDAWDAHATANLKKKGFHILATHTNRMSIINIAYVQSIMDVWQGIFFALIA